MESVGSAKEKNRVSAKISVLMPTNNKPHLLREVMNSILSQDCPNVELIIILNGTHADIEKILVDYKDRVCVIRNNLNVGFAVGMNQGAMIASGEYVYLTANDIVLPSNYLRNLVEAEEEADGWGLLSGVWQNYYEPEQVVIAGGLLRFTPSARSELLSQPRDATRPFDVDWITGASVFTTLSAWRALGGYREEFFFHVEDVELCLRARRAGGYVRVVPLAKLYHHEHDRGNSASHDIELYKLRNYAAINVLYGPAWGLPWVGLKYILYTVPRTAIALRSWQFYSRTITSTLVHFPGWIRERLTRRPKVGPFGV